MSVRELEARLARDVEDKILGRLGYRETDVWLPGAVDPMEPRPEVAEVTQSEYARVLPEQVLMELGKAVRPVQVYKLRIPRTWTPEQIRVPGTWYLKTDGQAKAPMLTLAVYMEDARWIVYLSTLRRF